MNWFNRLFRSPRSTLRTLPVRTPAERKHREMTQRLALAALPASSPLWQTVLEIVDEHERNMMVLVLQDKISSEERHFNAGLAASAEYLANALRDLKAQADAEALKRKQQD